MDFIATNMKFLRKQKNWTQNDLAEELDIKRSLLFTILLSSINLVT